MESAPNVAAEYSDPDLGYGLIECAASAKAIAWTNQTLDDLLAGRLSVWTEKAQGTSPTPRELDALQTGFTHVAEKLGAAALYLMGLPTVRSIIQSIGGHTMIPSHDWMVIKRPGSDSTISWHQDFVHERKHPAVTIGLHLDDLQFDGLRVVPKTHFARQDLCQIGEKYDFDSPEVVTLKVGPGGIVWHDAMLVHGSPALPLNAPARRTYYLEFRPRQALDEHPGFPSAYIDAREDQFRLAQETFRRFGSGSVSPVEVDLTEQEADVVGRLQSLRASVDLANYCTPLPL